jgi:uncharacterized protein YjbI with pentapeptide repeats
MANEKHLAMLQKGVDTWNKWRTKHFDIRPDLSGVNLDKAKLSGANLSGTDLSRVSLLTADLFKANLNGANLSGANLSGATLMEADLMGANLSSTTFYKSNLARADLSGANLSQASLIETHMAQAILVETNFKNAILDTCYIYGISAWDVNLEGASQKNLDISGYEQSSIVVDELELAQFINLLLNNSKIRNVIDTISSKAVLILGRFAPERKIVLDSLRDALRAKNYVPMLFDFEKPIGRDLTETIISLASLSRFVIADLTNPRSLPHELMAFVEKLPSVAVQPLILKDHVQYAMFEHLQRYPWVLPIHVYESQEALIQELSEKIIQAAEQKAKQETLKLQAGEK